MKTDGFINKLKKIVLKNIEDEKFGVRELAFASGLSRSQLLRKIKYNTGKSANKFIREIRLEEGLKLFNKEELTAAEISYKVGFNSPSYFNKCFLDQYGMTPGEYKKKLELGENIDPTDTYLPHVKIKRKKLMTGMITVLSLLIIGITYLMMKNKKEVEKQSIAVLPLLDLSKDKDKEYLADGITESIIMYLSKNKSFRIISRGSSMRYKGEKIPYRQIAKELDVDLLLEGSVIHSEDTLSVVMQLIEPSPKEKHIWANTYNQAHTNILLLSNTIAKDIAGKISVTGNPKENSKQKLSFQPKAYDLYLRGRHLWNNQKTRKNSLLRAEAYLKDAIRIEPKFALAYVTLAETYLAINTISGDNEDKLMYRKNAETAIDKALALNQSLAEAYITKGNLIGKFNWNWKAMKELAEKGLQLDPSNAYAHILLSDYYIVTNNYQKAINEALKAQQLDPINPYIGCIVAQRFYIAGEDEKSIKRFLDVIELNPDYGWAYDGLGFAYLKAGKRNQAIETWKKLQLIMGNDKLFECYENFNFKDCLMFFLDNATKNEPRFCSNPMTISSIFQIINDKQGALQYIEIAFTYKNESLPIMLTYPDFYNLRNYPEFKKIAQQVGVVLPEKIAQ